MFDVQEKQAEQEDARRWAQGVSRTELEARLVAVDTLAEEAA